jgi:hypothetical protein
LLLTGNRDWPQALKQSLKSTNALLDTRDAASEHWVVGHQIVAEVTGAGSTEAPHRMTGGKTVINLNRRM